MTPREKLPVGDPWSACRSVFLDGLKRWNLQLKPDQWLRFERLFQDLCLWNKRVNLTAITDPGEIATKHFLDSITPVLFPDTIQLDSVLDLGTGGGFPGIPLKIVHPGMDLTLVEKSEKKSAFLHTIVGELALSHVRILTSRIEDLQSDEELAGRFQTVLARALAPPEKAIELAFPFVHRHGEIVLYTIASAPKPTPPTGYTLKLLPVRPAIDDIERALLIVNRP